MSCFGSDWTNGRRRDDGRSDKINNIRLRRPTEVESALWRCSKTKKGPVSNCSSDSLLLLPALRERDVFLILRLFFFPAACSGGAEERQTVV